MTQLQWLCIGTTCQNNQQHQHTTFPGHTPKSAPPSDLNSPSVPMLSCPCKTNLANHTLRYVQGPTNTLPKKSNNSVRSLQLPAPIIRT